jgi:predicted outer membrane repeat protein
MKKNTPLTLLAAALALLGCGIAHATSYTVTTACDDYSETSCSEGSMTLRDAINHANAEAAAAGTATDTINFNIPAGDPGCSAGVCTITPLGVLPGVSTALTLTIDASASTQSIVISGQPGVPMLQNNGPLNLNALTIANFSCNSNTEGCNFSAIRSYYAPLTVSNSTFMSNSFVNGYGAAILQQNSTLTITNSTFYNNSVGYGGGAIDCDGCTLTVTNSTFSGNTTTTPGDGGAIYNGGTATLYNTILAGGGPSGNCNTGIGNALIDGGGNLSDDTNPNNPCHFNTEGGTSYYVPDMSSGEFPGLNLGPLASNGGPTQTVALLSGSVAISSGVAANCPATDQRGVARPVGGQSPRCSSGAFQNGTVQNGSGTASGCTAPAICNITGGENQSLAAGTPAAAAALAALTGSAATITENVCTVNMDPRQICPPGIPGNPYYNSRTLPVAAVCPNLPSGGAGTSVIPDYLCGGYGPNGAGSGTGFAVIQGIANGVNAIPGLLNLNDANPDAFFPPGGSSECLPDGAFVSNVSDGWGPWSLSPVEGTIPEGNRIIELTDGCGGNKQTTSGMSLTLIGVTLNLANATQELGRLPKTLVNFAEFKYINLAVELAKDPIDTANKVRLITIVVQSALFLAAGKNGCAEDTLYEADRYVINNASHFHGAPAIDPNSYGRTRARILNLFFTLFTRLDGNPNPITNVGANINFPLLAPSLSGPPASCSAPYLGPDKY